MSFRIMIRKAVTALSLTAVVTTTSMVALASPAGGAAEVTVSGKLPNGETPFVMVNGEASRSGRSVFSSSTVATPEGATAVLSIGKTGRIELSPDSAMNVVFDDDSVDAELTAGTLTVLGALGTVNVRTNDGKTTQLNPGESISASGNAAAKRQAGSSDKTWIWLLVAGGAAAAVLVAVAASSGDDDVVSPNR